MNIEDMLKSPAFRGHINFNGVKMRWEHDAWVVFYLNNAISHERRVIVKTSDTSRACLALINHLKTH